MSWGRSKIKFSMSEADDSPCKRSSIGIRPNLLQPRTKLRGNLLGHGVVDQADSYHVRDVNLIYPAESNELQDQQFSQLEGIDSIRTSDAFNNGWSWIEIVRLYLFPREDDVHATARHRIGPIQKLGNAVDFGEVEARRRHGFGGSRQI